MSLVDLYKRIHEAKANEEELRQLLQEKYADLDAANKALNDAKLNKKSPKAIKDLQEKIKKAEFHKETVLYAVENFSKQKVDQMIKDGQYEEDEEFDEEDDADTTANAGTTANGATIANDIIVDGTTAEGNTTATSTIIHGTTAN